MAEEWQNTEEEFDLQEDESSIAEDETPVKEFPHEGQILVGGMGDEPLRWVDKSEYGFAGTETGQLPVEHGPVTSKLGQRYSPATDVYGKQDVQLARAYQAYIEDSYKATDWYAPPEIAKQIQEARRIREEEESQVREFIESLTHKREYDVFKPADKPENYATDEDGNIVTKTTIHKDAKFKRRNTIVQEKVFKEVAFKHYIGSAGDPETEHPEKGELVVLKNVTMTEARRAAEMYVDIIKQTGTTHPLWARGRWWERIPGYTKEGFGETRNIYNEEASFIELLYGTPGLSGVARGLTHLIRLPTPSGVDKTIQWTMNKEKQFWNWVWEDDDVKNKSEHDKWTRELTVRQVKYLIDAPDREGRHLYMDLLAENLAITFGALKLIRVVPRSKTLFKDISDRVMATYRTDAIENLKNRKLQVTERNIQREIDRISGAQFIQDSHKLIQSDILEKYEESAKRWNRLRQWGRTAMFSIGNRPGRFLGETALQDVGFTTGMWGSKEKFEVDSGLGQIMYGLGAAVVTPGLINMTVRTGAFVSLKSIDTVKEGLTFLGIDWKAGERLYKAIEGTGDIAALQGLLVKKVITKKEYDSAYKFFRGLSEMPVDFRNKAMDSLKETTRIKQELDVWVREMATQNTDGLPLLANQTILDSKLATEFNFDPKLTTEQNVKNITDKLNLSLGQSLQIKLLDLAEVRLIDAGELGISLDYGFMSHAKILEEKYEAARSLNKFLDVMNAKYNKATASKDMINFLDQTNAQVHSAFGEVEANLETLKKLVEGMAAEEFIKRAETGIYTAGTARLENLLDTYASIMEQQLHVGGKFGPEEIAKEAAIIRKKLTSDKLMIAGQEAKAAVRKLSRGDANQYDSSKVAAVGYVDSWHKIKQFGSDRYDIALKDADYVFSEDSFDFLMDLRRTAIASKSDTFAGAEVGDVVRVIDDLLNPVAEKKLDEVYSAFVGLELDGEVLNSVEEVKKLLRDNGVIDPNAGALDQLNYLKDNLDDLTGFGIDISEINLNVPLRMDDLDNVIQGLNARIGKLDSLNLKTDSSIPGARAQYRKLQEVHGHLDAELKKAEGLLRKTNPAKWAQYQEAKEFYRFKVVPVLYKNDITKWIMNTKRKVPVTETNPTGYEHVNSLSGKGTDDGFLDYIWGRILKDPESADTELRKMFGVWDGENWIFVTDDMIANAKASTMGDYDEVLGGTYMGYTADELTYIKEKQIAFRKSFDDYYVGRFQESIRNLGEKAGVGADFRYLTKDDIKSVDEGGKGRKGKVGDIDMEEYADRLESVNEGGSTENLVSISLAAHRTLFKEASGMDNSISKELFDSHQAIYFRKKLNNVDYNNKQIVKQLKESDDAMERAQKGLLNLPQIEEHQNILKNIVGNIIGKKGNIDDVFQFLVLDAPGANKIEMLREFLVNGKVSAEMNVMLTRFGKDGKVLRRSLQDKTYKFLQAGTMSEKHFDDMMGRILAVGIRRAATVEMRPTMRLGVDFWAGEKKKLPIGTVRGKIPKSLGYEVEYGVDHIKLLSILQENSKALEGYIDVGAMRVISQIGSLMTPAKRLSDVPNLSSPTKGVATFTPASWISRFYAANSGRTSYRYIGAEAVVAALLKNKAGVTLALLENRTAQRALAEMFAKGKPPTQMMGHHMMSWLTALAVRAEQIVEIDPGSFVGGVADKAIPSIYDMPFEDQQMLDIFTGA
jgi:hypothetical protein